MIVRRLGGKEVRRKNHKAGKPESQIYIRN